MKCCGIKTCIYTSPLYIKECTVKIVNKRHCMKNHKSFPNRCKEFRLHSLFGNAREIKYHGYK
jgi:hypothetical protein